MQAQHQPASHAFTVALLRILQKTEAMLQRRVGGAAPMVDDNAPDSLDGLEVQDSDWGAWVEAGGDLLMGLKS